ncbi:hypothetical protein CsSME_00001568 [Camellia sinensis var. sinensis]
MTVDSERLTWLYCYGVPPSLWNSKNFKKSREVWGEVVGIHDKTLSMASLKCGKVEIITSHVEIIDNMVIMESRGISHPIRVVECMQQSHGYHSEEVVNESKSWVNNGSHGRVNQSSMFKQMAKEEDDANKAVSNDDLDAQGEVAKNQWVDMKKMRLMHAGHCNSLTVSSEKETAGELETQIAAVDSSGTKTSMQCKSIHSQVVGNCTVIENFGPFGLMRSLSDNGIVRPTINLEVVLSQVQYEGLCDGLELGLER